MVGLSCKGCAPEGSGIAVPMSQNHGSDVPVCRSYDAPHRPFHPDAEHREAEGLRLFFLNLELRTQANVLIDGF